MEEVGFLFSNRIAARGTFTVEAVESVRTRTGFGVAWPASLTRSFCRRILELLLVLAITGLMALVVIPGAIAFIGEGNLTAADVELQNVKTAELGYYGDHEYCPGDSSELTGYVSSSPKATYTFDTTTGLVVGVSNVRWSGITWNSEEETWTR